MTDTDQSSTPTCRRGHALTDGNTWRRSNGRTACRTCKREYNSAYYAANRGRVLRQKSEYHARNRDRKQEYNAAYQRDARQGALDAYGRSCACCGESTERFLTIDHTNGDGAEHRNELRGSGGAVYLWLRREGYPTGFQTLCTSCNAGRHINGGACPHTAPVTPPQSANQRWKRALKAEAVGQYGGACACCGEAELTFLCIDHIEGGGNQHRAELFGDRRIASHRFRSWLRAQGWPPGHQVLCFNCNDGKHFNGGTCPHEEEGR